MSKLAKLFLSGVSFLGATSSLLAADEIGGAATGDGAAAGIGVTLLYIAIMLIVIISAWKVFTKAGKPGWAILIPIYNTIVMIEIAKRPIWWFFLLLIPFVGIVIAVIICIDIAKNFGKGAGFGLGLAFLPFIFYPILGFGDSQYNG